MDLDVDVDIDLDVQLEPGQLNALINWHLHRRRLFLLLFIVVARLVQISNEIFGQVDAASAVEHAEAMTSISFALDKMLKAFAASGITTNTDIYREAMAKLNEHQVDVSMDDFFDLAEYLTSPENKQHAIFFIGMKDPLYRKCWLERCLEEVKKNRGA